MRSSYSAFSAARSRCVPQRQEFPFRLGSFTDAVDPPWGWQVGVSARHQREYPDTRSVSVAARPVQITNGYNRGLRLIATAALWLANVLRLKHGPRWAWGEL